MPDDKKYYESVQVFELFAKDDMGTAVGYAQLKDGAFADQADYTATESIFDKAWKAGDIVMVARAKFQKKTTSGKSLRDKYSTT